MKLSFRIIFNLLFIPQGDAPKLLGAVPREHAQRGKDSQFYCQQYHHLFQSILFRYIILYIGTKYKIRKMLITLHMFAIKVFSCHSYGAKHKN